MFATNSKQIYKYIQRMKEQKQGRRKEREGRKEKRREERYGEGKWRGENTTSSSLFFFS